MSRKSSVVYTSCMELNPAQNKAVLHENGPLLVLAGAGSGKTRVITHRIAHLIELGIPPSEILAVTFTNKAAEEMRARIQHLKNAHVLACTFHSLGSRILRESIHHLGYKNTFTIYDEADSEKLLKSCLDQLGIPGEKGFLKETRNYISDAKNSLTPPSEQGGDLLSQIYRLYTQKLKEYDAVDFDDLLYLTVQLLRTNPETCAFYQTRWRYVLIDEYQDTNFAQYTLAKILCEKHKNIFAVGDPDQSIYSWRGARYQNILNFENDFPGAIVITLDQNYRSTNTILQAANALIQKNINRYEKKLWSSLGDGSKIAVFIGHNERLEAEFVASRIKEHTEYGGASLNDIAIFYRTNAQSRTFEDTLLARKIPYTIIGGVSFYERKEVKDLLAFLRLIISSSDMISFLRTINIPKRGLGAATLEKIMLAASHRTMPIITFCEEMTEQDVKLSLKQKEGLKNYLQIIHRLRAIASQQKISSLLQEVISSTGYLAYLQEDPETAQDRKENIEALLDKAAEWEEEREDPSLHLFLEELSLRSSVKENQEIASVKMMTLHNSKGLEFPIVFLVGLEEDILPHINSKDDTESLEEERRLCYVGITRAKKTLYLTSATYRYVWGVARLMRISRFLKEIPEELTLDL